MKKQKARKAEKPDNNEQDNQSGSKSEKAGKALLAPLKWVYVQYPKKYMSLGTNYSVGSITKNTIDHSRSIRNNPEYKIKNVRKNYKKIPKSFSKARRKYFSDAKRLGMTYEDRVSEVELGCFIQCLAVALLTLAFCYSISNNFRTPNGSEMLMVNNGINASILLLSTKISAVIYLVGTWKSFSARNMMQLDHILFAYIILRHPTELFPFWNLDDTLESRYNYKNKGRSV